MSTFKDENQWRVRLDIHVGRCCSLFGNYSLSGNDWEGNADAMRYNKDFVYDDLAARRVRGWTVTSSGVVRRVGGNFC